MKIAIIGFGHVGQAMANLFKSATIYDEPKTLGNKKEVNEADVAFICVPTPMKKDGSCDTSIVESVISWCGAKCIVIRSTVKVGFTEEMTKKYHKEIVFQPEYYGETVAHPFADLSTRNWITLGGSKKGIDLVISAYQEVLNSNVRIYQCTSKEAEMAKYMENAYLATKVTFCNEMYDLCDKLGIDYNVVRELWVADPRIGTSHTFVYKDNRGYGGSCLPKDVSSLLKQGEELKSDMELLKAVSSKNNKYKK